MDCHETAETADEPGMPTKETCVDCHDSPEDEPVDAEIDKLPSLEWKTFSPDPDVRFSHVRHIKKGYACETCHGEIAQSDEVTAEYAPGQETCIACHQKEGVSTDCVTCHYETRLEKRPETHTLSWAKMHGTTFREGGSFDHSSPCDRCHGEDACTKCHREQPPRDHNQTWRERTHGLLAGIERERCATCHTEDTCIRCHLSGEVVPRSHRRGAWGGRRANHCVSCHEDPEVANCTICHRATPSHLQAPQPPARPGHVTGADCRSCHVALVHADDGGSCERCHMP